MGSNNYSEGGCYELDTSVDEAISYYSALQILQQRIAELTAEEFCTWVVLGYLHAFESVNDGGDEAELATKLLAVSRPFARADYRSKPLDLLLPYRFSRSEIESFDPESTTADWNAGGRFLTYGQAVQRLATYADKEYAEKLIDREVRSGVLESIHPVLGVLESEAGQDQGLDLRLHLCLEDVLKYLMFPRDRIEELREEEFKGVEARRHPELNELERSARLGTSSGANLFQGLENLRWDEIVISFVTDDAVRIRTRRVDATYTYVEMGFKNRKARDASPDANWRIFRTVFAPVHGEVFWSSSSEMPVAERHKLKMVVYFLRKRLKQFFGIDDDPFHPYRKENSYKTKFMLLPDEDALDEYRAHSSDGGNDD